ncbi:MAG: deoxynucleoside kinase [Sarcina sp.]
MIVIDGVVGVGKSTLMNIFAKEMDMVKFEEPVVENPILPKFYGDRKRYAFPSQVFFLNSRFAHLKEAGKIQGCVLDRSIYGDAIFAKTLCKSGDMTKEEFAIYEELLENMVNHIKVPKLMIYLEVSVKEAMKRIQKRGRDFEQKVEREYWESLNEEYKSYFDNYNLSPILKINVDNLDFENNEEDKEKILTLIKNRLSDIR